MIMPFGKHKGEDMEDIPSDYLRWLAENCDSESIAIAAEEEYSYREKYNMHKWEERG